MLTTDVVCGMQVDCGNHQVAYMGLPYSFCSEQCKERFQANPHLYIGLPGQKAPKQEGLAVIRQRRLHLAEPLSTDHAKALADSLQAMMGIQAVSFEGVCMTITYDLLQATAEQIEEKLKETGTQLGKGMAERFRRAFVHYEEDCVIGNLEVHPGKRAHRH